MLFLLTYSDEEWEDEDKRMNYLCFIGRNLDH